MKPIVTNYNAFEWRFPRTFKELNGYEYESTIVSPLQKRQRIWKAIKVSISIALGLTVWFTYSLHTL